MLAASNPVLAAHANVPPEVHDARPTAPPEPAASPEEPAEQVPYEVNIRGVPEDDLKNLLRRTSQLAALEDKPPSTMAGLERRARDDLERMRAALRSEGFYGAELAYRIDEDATPALVEVDIETGPVYLLADYAIHYDGALRDDVKVPRGPDDLDLHVGMRARAPRIVAAQRELLRRLENRGYPLAKVADRTARVNHGETTLAVDLRVDPGPFARFGALDVEGLGRTEEDYVRGFQTWEPGARYDRSKLEATRSDIMQTGLFASARFSHGDRVGPDGRLPITLQLKERAPRSIGFGAGFDTSEGPSGNVFWEHRNIFGRAERLRLSLEASPIRQVFDSLLRKPRFLRPDQDLLVDGTLTRRESEAFNEQSLATFVGLERDIGERWRGSLGVSAEITETEDNEGERTFALLGTPLTLTRDTSDSLLNPTEGTRATLTTTPYVATLEDELGFVRSSFALSGYYAVDEAERFILAGRGRAGVIVGTATENIPPSKRFFAGGGGSIRGYNFEKVGPLDRAGDPLGGRSLVELSLELRVRITESIGIVPFIDGGNVYDEPYFDDGGGAPLRWAGGLGLRYFTAIGPVRLDVATPLNPRRTDDDFEFYISLGQAF